MKALTFMLAVVTGLALIAVNSWGQCSGGRCPAPSFGPAFGPATRVAPPIYVQPAPSPAPLARRTITYQGLDFEVEGVLRDGGSVIDWHPEAPFNARSLAAARAKAAATPRPAPSPTPKMVVQNFGIEPGKHEYRDDHYTAPSDESRRFVAGAKQAEADAGKLHVTVIGTDDERAPVVNDLKTHPAFAGLRDSLLIQDYRPDEWAVDPSLGFRAGKPAIVVQTARGPGDPRGGRVVYRSRDYAMGPAKLAEAIRKADPNYRPQDDPGPDGPAVNPASCPLGFSRDHWPEIVVAGLVLVAFYARKRGAR